MDTPSLRHDDPSGLSVHFGGAARFLMPLAVACLSGCAGLWDEVTSKNFTVKSIFVKPDPIVVLKESTDGDDRAKAIRRVKEPKVHGGTEEQQKLVMDLLIQTATSDRQPLCRLAAVERLGHFKDPRVLEGLENAFIAAQNLPPDLMLRVQCQAITSIGETGNPAAVKFLIEKLKEPPAERTDFAQQRSDRCIAAARALAKFNDPQATAALAQTLQKEKRDVALRDCVHDTLVKQTGKDLPPDAVAWNQFVNPGEAVVRDDEKAGKISLMSWVAPKR